MGTLYFRLLLDNQWALWQPVGMEHGSILLAEWIARRFDGVQSAAAAKVGVHKSVMNKLLKGTRLPGRQTATILRDMAGIPLDAWVPTRGGKTRKTHQTKARNGQHWQGATA
jgi:plasmid maintenance system antidote protein VapI